MVRRRPTVRGVAVAVVAVAAIGNAYVAGPRALNAIAAPALVALLASATHLVVVDPPTVERSPPQPGVPGQSRTARLDIDGRGVARVIDTIPAGVTTDTVEQRVTLPATVTTEIDLRTRGEWTVGPATVVETDVLGLVVRRTRTEATTTALVYPSVYDLRDHGELAAVFDRGTASDREAFDSIREYAPGDPLRDVHWKSSAKREPGELVVKQFTADQDTEEHHIAASAADGYADDMASAAASIAVLALSAGLSVSLTCPAGTVQPGRGPTHRRHLLDLLARTDDGHLDDRAESRADLLVHADADGVAVTVEDETYTLDIESMETGVESPIHDSTTPSRRVP